jgi:hypothetical protein
MKNIEDYEPLDFTSKVQYMRERSPQQMQAFPIEFWESQYAFLLTINEVEYQLFKGEDEEALRLLKSQANPVCWDLPEGEDLEGAPPSSQAGRTVTAERKQTWENLVQRGRDAYGGAPINFNDPLVQAIYQVWRGEDEKALATLRAYFEEYHTP